MVFGGANDSDLPCFAAKQVRRLAKGKRSFVSMRRREEEGIALVITLMVMTILLVMGTAFLSISSTETLIAINERNRIQAFHLAEAGAERAVAELNVNGAYAGTGGEQALGLGTYTVDVCPPNCVPPAAPPADPNQQLITATGCVRNCTTPSNAVASVAMVVERISPFQLALAALYLVELEDRVEVDSYDSAQGSYGGPNVGAEAHIASNGNIIVHSNDTVNGNAQAGGSVTLGSGSTITGSVTEGVSSVAVYPVDTSYTTPNENSTGISPSSAYNSATYDLTIGSGETVTLDPGTYYFNSITLETGAQLAMTGPAVIYMTDKFSAQSGAVINTSKIPANLTIFSSVAGADAIKMHMGGGEFYGAIYALDAEVEVDVGGWQIYGSIIAHEVDFFADVRFHYDLALAGSSLPAGRFRPVAGTWQELFASP